MAIKLQDEAALIIRLADEITGAVVDHNQFVVFRKGSELAQGLGLSDDAVEKVERYCGDSGLSAFVRREINAQLVIDNDFANAIRAVPLRSYEPFSDPVSYAKILVSKLKSLPHRYRLTVKLPDEFSKPLLPLVAAVKLSESIALCRSDRLPSSMPLTSPHQRIDRSLFSDVFTSNVDDDREFDAGSLFFTSIELSHEVQRYTSQSPVVFSNRIRAFYGACLALGMLGTDFSSKRHRKPFIIVHTEEQEREILSTDELGSDLWDNRFYRSTKKFVEESADPARSVRSVMDKISLIFGSDEFSNRLFTACIWFYRARFNSNPLDSLLHSTIAIEVLLGDREAADSVGLAKLLGNRCAYLLGTSRQERQSIMDEFLRIYRLRSAIVHTGRHHSTKTDRLASQNCLKLCGNVIAKELDLHYSEDLDVTL